MDSWKILTKIFFSVPPVFREELRAPTFTDKQTCNIFFVSHGTNLFFGSHSTKVNSSAFWSRMTEEKAPKWCSQYTCNLILTLYQHFGFREISHIKRNSRKTSIQTRFEMESLIMERFKFPKQILHLWPFHSAWGGEVQTGLTQPFAVW